MKKFILSIALPSALQGMITVAMSFIDTLMLGSLTESSIAAASLASRCSCLRSFTSGCPGEAVC